jgi:6-hydroxycyclohex-1-ene-1-carbonyl-CoA dehydrogenase
MSNTKIKQWQMTELNKEFKLSEINFPDLAEGEVLVKVAGCGVCHTDISFWHYGV